MMTNLTSADGHSFEAWIEPAQGPRKGGVVIVQEIFGVTDQLKSVARRYAALGYEVAIPALFDRSAPGSVIPFDRPDDGRALMQKAALDQSMMDIDAARAALAAHGGKVGVIGFCWGGGLAFRAAQILDVACAVSFYGTQLRKYLDRPLKAPVQGHFGKTDDHTPPDLVAETQSYLGDLFELFTYDAGHAFANDVRPVYVPDAARLAHERTEAFLAKHLG
ncbi:MAG: dienelactone hydrolase family protein [Maritimibacter sp.]|nr:dienelactone hydrolase family protein [Maritimibacter sp.]